MELNFYFLLYIIWFFSWPGFVFGGETHKIDTNGISETWVRFEKWNKSIGIEKGSLLAILSMFVYVSVGWYLGMWILIQFGWEVAN